MTPDLFPAPNWFLLLAFSTTSSDWRHFKRIPSTNFHLLKPAGKKQSSSDGLPKKKWENKQTNNLKQLEAASFGPLRLIGAMLRGSPPPKVAFKNPAEPLHRLQGGPSVHRHPHRQAGAHAAQQPPGQCHALGPCLSSNSGRWARKPRKPRNMGRPGLVAFCEAFFFLF